MTTLAQKMRGEKPEPPKPKLPEPNRAYYECTHCSYREYTKKRFGPKHVQCFTCGAMLTYRVLES
jgi:hypothetical protein